MHAKQGRNSGDAENQKHRQNDRKFNDRESG